MRRSLCLLSVCLALPLQGVAAWSTPGDPCPMEDMAMASDAMTDGSGAADAMADCCNDALTYMETGQPCKTGMDCGAPVAHVPPAGLLPTALPARRVQVNVATLRQQLLAITAQSEARLASANNLAVFSLSDRLGYFVNGFNLDLVGTDAREDGAWTAEALAAFTQRLRSGAVAAVLHHRELSPPLAQAVQAAGVRTIVLQTEGRDPLGELRENSQRLSALAMGR